MIYYSTDTWWTQIVRFRGTVWKEVWWKVVGIFFYTLAAYRYCEFEDGDLGHMSHNILGSTLSFLLVFRANNAYKRYWQGRTWLTTFFNDLRDMCQMAIIFIPGGNRNNNWRWLSSGDDGSRKRLTEADLRSLADDDDQLASEERTHVIRLCLILANALKMHTRILDEGLNHGSISKETRWLADWDRYRIRLLTNADEFAFLDSYVTDLCVPKDGWKDLPMDHLEGVEEIFAQEAPPADWPETYTLSTVPSMRLPVAVVYRLNEVAVRNMNDAKLQDKPYGITERFVPMFGKVNMKLLLSFDLINQCVCTPLPSRISTCARRCCSGIFLCSRSLSKSTWASLRTSWSLRASRLRSLVSTRLRRNWRILSEMTRMIWMSWRKYPLLKQKP